MAKIEEVVVPIGQANEGKVEVEVPTLEWGIEFLSAHSRGSAINLFFKADKEGSAKRVIHFLLPGGKIPIECLDSESVFLGSVETEAGIYFMYLCDERFM